MVTMVGKQIDFTKALKSLAELEHDAISAYESAISGLKDHRFIYQLTEFNKDHKQRTLRNFLVF